MCDESGKSYVSSSLTQWGSEWAIHLEQGKTVKCDICRGDLCDNSGLDEPAYICGSCGK